MEIRILVDLNIVLDVLHARQPFVHLSGQVWAAVETRQVSGAIAAHNVATLFCLLHKRAGSRHAHAILGQTLRVFQVAAVDSWVVERALALAWVDFEDALQMAAAEKDNAQYLVTRNARDFPGGFVTLL